ncbi:hypothetical protein [Scytonema sp. PCC 10023]|uniref:hypothetical protein n=1 Tax=Scytonema sp. PCC 10023 TaxID=1680591 RepID=UPI0039C7497E
MSTRLIDIDEILDLRYEILTKAEKRLAIVDDIFAKISIEQRIREEIIPELRKYEAKYWQLLSQEAHSHVIAELNARNAITEVVRELEMIEKKPSMNYPDEFMRLLLEIRDKLNESGKPAAAKVKLALPLIPGILSYEVELDTESSLRRAFQLIRRLFKGH